MFYNEIGGNVCAYVDNFGDNHSISTEFHLLYTTYPLQKGTNSE